MGNSSYLKIQRFERNLSYHLLFVVVVDFLQLGQLFAAHLLYLLVTFLGKGRARGTKMAWFSAAEAELFFNATLLFFRGKLGDLDGVNDHSIRVVSLGVGGVCEGVVGLVRGF